MADRNFPTGFSLVWATSPCRIESASKEEGRGEVVGDQPAETPDRTGSEMTVSVALGDYRRDRDENLMMLADGGHGFGIDTREQRI